MPYQPTAWVNDSEPFITAENLNKIETCLVELTDRDALDITAQGVTWSAGKIARFSHSCMFDLEFRAPVAVGGETEIYQFPVGYKPYIDFGVPVINTSDFSYVGICEYDSVQNVLTFRSNVQDSVMCRISCFYVTTDKPI